MLYVSFARLKDEEVGRLREWLGALPKRRGEAEETYTREGTRAEVAYLIDGKNGLTLVYVMEVEDIEKARIAFQESQLPIDLEFKDLMEEVVAAPAAAELLYEYPYRK